MFSHGGSQSPLLFPLTMTLPLHVHLHVSLLADLDSKLLPSPLPASRQTQGLPSPALSQYSWKK